MQHDIVNIVDTVENKVHIHITLWSVEEDEHFECLHPDPSHTHIYLDHDHDHSLVPCKRTEDDEGEERV